MMDWRVQHRAVMIDFLMYMNGVNKDFTLSGGSALMLCYGLDRFLGNIELDSRSAKIWEIVNNYSVFNGYQYRIIKETYTDSEYAIGYGGKMPLRVMISHRMPPKEIKSTSCRINNIMVHDVSQLLILKSQEYIGGEEIVDLYDMVFILSKYREEISKHAVRIACNALTYKGYKHFEYLVASQYRASINMDVLVKRFNEVWEMLDLR